MTEGGGASSSSSESVLDTLCFCESGKLHPFGQIVKILQNGKKKKRNKGQTKEEEQDEYTRVQWDGLLFNAYTDACRDVLWCGN